MERNREIESAIIAVKLYFNDYGAKEAIRIARLEREGKIKLDDIETSRGWSYQQLKI